MKRKRFGTQLRIESILESLRKNMSGIDKQPTQKIKDYIDETWCLWSLEKVLPGINNCYKEGEKLMIDDKNIIPLMSIRSI